MQKFKGTSKNPYLIFIFCMNDRFTSMQLFVRVARSGSFSAAARELGISQPTASRAVTALEGRVGASLLLRNTRTVTLTEAGIEYLSRCEAILAALDEADQAVREAGELRGVLRVAMPLSFALRVLMPRLALFTDRHPKLRIDFALDDARTDLIGNSVDVAVRIGALGNSNVVARKIGVIQRILVASPAYLSRAGMPQDPSDLVRHALIVGPAGQGAEAWSFGREGRSATVRAQGRFQINANEGGIKAAVAGMGVCLCGDWAVRQELQEGSLVQVLPDWETRPFDVHVILSAGRAAKASARAFADFVAMQVREIDAEPRTPAAPVACIVPCPDRQEACA